MRKRWKNCISHEKQIKKVKQLGKMRSNIFG